jgi:hypothetical protein
LVNAHARSGGKKPPGMTRAGTGNVLEALRRLQIGVRQSGR